MNLKPIVLLLPSLGLADFVGFVGFVGFVPFFFF